MFNLFFKFNKEYIHKKIVIQNLNISEDKSENISKTTKTLLRLDKFSLIKGKLFKTDSFRFLIKKRNFWVLFKRLKLC